MIRNCYIHIPFCHSICSYCDFCKLLYREDQVDKYLEALEKEIKSTYEGEILETIYIGGGTPSSLSISQLEKLFTIISVFKKTSDCEFTIEGNIESTTIDKLLLYKKYGINRLSFGIESVHKSNLLFLERTFSMKNCKEIIKEAKRLGFSNINLDLMYALPSESIDMLTQDLEAILSLKPEHISTYSLIIEEHTKLAIENVRSINDEEDFKMYKLISKVLKDNGYKHYEISNFCLSGYESRHNLCYWNNKEYYGFGLGACSYIKNERIANTRSFNNYVNEKYCKEKEKISMKSKIEYQILLNLRKSEGINLKDFQKLYHKDFKELYDYSSLIEKKILKEEGDYLFIPENKWYISNEIIVQLLGCEKNE